MRSFVSVDLPEDLIEAVADVQETFRDASGLSFTDPERAHVTLQFLGEVDPERLPEVKAALETAVEDAGVSPFEATYGGLGAFPGIEYISVLWLGVTAGGAEMTRLHEAIETETTALGFDPEGHEFTPHVTIARMNHAGGKELVQKGVRELDPTVGTARVEEIRLKRSDLDSEGPTYTTVASVRL
jgi:2'-5' RNA ligase